MGIWYTLTTDLVVEVVFAPAWHLLRLDGLAKLRSVSAALLGLYGLYILPSWLMMVENAVLRPTTSGVAKGRAGLQGAQIASVSFPTCHLLPAEAAKRGRSALSRIRHVLNY